MKTYLKNLRISAIAACAALMLSSCAQTYQARGTKPSGFLKDYSQLTAKGGDTMLLSYINPKANFRQYKKIMMYPVAIYAAPDSDIGKLDKDESQELISYMTSELYEQLKDDYQFVKTPGPDVMTLRVALTDADASKVVLDTVGTILPYGAAASHIKKLITGRHLAVGSARAEFELLDSSSNVRLAAAVDERSGGKTLFGGQFDEYGDAKNAIDFWAKKISTRLDEVSGRPVSASK